LVSNDFKIGKNIFKKMGKIPPRELQNRGGVIQWRDESED
jgi:hypothetical protein